MWDKIFHVPIIALGILHYLGSINGLRPKDEAGTNFAISWRMHRTNFTKDKPNNSVNIVYYIAKDIY